MTRGVPPTAPKDRTGEETPPGMSSAARAMSRADVGGDVTGVMREPR
jgi:hypothetical protein